jgi:hypothetical protein
VIAASFLTLVLAAAAAAFAVGFTGTLTENLADPGSAPRLKAAALARLDESLGPVGFLNAYREFLLTGDPGMASELRRFADQADADIAAFARALPSEEDRESAASLRRLEAPFRRASMFALGANGNTAGLAPLDRLERDYAALKRAIAEALEAAAFDRIDGLAQALVWAQALLVGALALFSSVLFALACILRDRMIAPLETLRRSLAGAGAGDAASPIWGIARHDEIGAVARAAERLRLSTKPTALRIFPHLHLDAMERMAKGAARLEADFSKTAAATDQARLSIEQASLDVAKASRDAVEAAKLARNGARLMAAQSEEPMKAGRSQSRNVIDALVSAVDRLANPAARWEHGAARKDVPKNGAAARSASAALGDDEAAAVLENLADGLDALENFARRRPSLADDQLVALTASLLQAVDRLNLVAQSVTASADYVRAAE